MLFPGPGGPSRPSYSAETPSFALLVCVCAHAHIHFRNSAISFQDAMKERELSMEKECNNWTLSILKPLCWALFNLQNFIRFTFIFYLAKPLNNTDPHTQR